MVRSLLFLNRRFPDSSSSSTPPSPSEESFGDVEMIDEDVITSSRHHTRNHHHHLPPVVLSSPNPSLKTLNSTPYLPSHITHDHELVIFLGSQAGIRAAASNASIPVTKVTVIDVQEEPEDLSLKKSPSSPSLSPPPAHAASSIPLSMVSGPVPSRHHPSVQFVGHHSPSSSAAFNFAVSNTIFLIEFLFELSSRNSVNFSRDKRDFLITHIMCLTFDFPIFSRAIKSTDSRWAYFSSYLNSWFFFIFNILDFWWST